MENKVLDINDLIKVPEDESTNENWKDYSGKDMTIEKAMEENFLSGKQKRRLRRLQERKLKKFMK